MHLFVSIFSAVNNFPWRKIETQGGNCSRIDIFLIDRVSKCHLADLVVQLDKWEWVLTSWLRRIEVNDKSSVRGLINVWERDNHRDVEVDDIETLRDVYIYICIYRIFSCASSLENLIDCFSIKSTLNDI